MKHEVPHDLEFDVAKKAVDRAFEAYRQRFADYSPTMSWTNDRRAEVGFSVKGIKLSGAIEVLPRTIGMELNVPFVFRIFKNQALKVIEQEISRWVAKARAGEL